MAVKTDVEVGVKADVQVGFEAVSHRNMRWVLRQVQVGVGAGVKVGVGDREIAQLVKTRGW